MKKIISLVLLLILISCSPSFIFEEHTSADKYILRNGLTVIIKQNPNTDLAVFDLFIKTGALTENINGISYLTSRMLLTGTKSKNREELIDFLERDGGSFKVIPSIQYNDIRVTVPSSEISTGLKFLLEILSSPSFKAVELEKEKKFVLDEIKQKQDSPLVVADEMLYAKLYFNTPYANPVEGTPETVNLIQITDIEKYYADWYAPNNMILIVAGNVNDDLIKEINKVFSFALKSKKIEEKTVVFEEYETGKFERNKYIDSFYVNIGFRTVPAVHEDYIKLKVLNGLIGKGPASRFYYYLREEQGLAYHIDSSYPTIKDTGLLRITIITSEPDKAISEALKEIEKIKKWKIGSEELKEVKSRVKGYYAINHQKSYDQAEYLGIYEVTKKGYAFDYTYPYAVDKVSSEDIQEMANKYLHNPVITVVGPIKGGELKSIKG